MLHCINCCAFHLLPPSLPPSLHRCCTLQAIFEQVEFRQANLGNRGNCERVFADEEGRFDFVFNLACETKYGQINEVREGGQGWAGQCDKGGRGGVRVVVCVVFRCIRSGCWGGRGSV